MARKTVFISHISTETELAQCLKLHLAADFSRSIDVFVSSDTKSIAAGKKWLVEVEKALKRTDLQIVLCSKESVGRPWVNFEAGAVWLRGIPVVPVCHSGMKPIELPVPLSVLQAIEANRPEGLRQVYEAVAATLETRMPAVDFGAVANQVKEIEKKYEQAQQPGRIENPRVLCAASKQYAQPELGFHLDVNVLERTFPKNVTVEPELTGKRLLNLLMGQRFDIVHLVIAVDPANGDLLFSPIDFGTYKPTTENPDRMSPTAFAALLEETHASLVVLATCKALLLAVEVAHVTNMAASDADITGVAAAEWEETFYGLLARGTPLYAAFDKMKSLNDNPIRPIRHKDAVFGVTPPGRDGTDAAAHPADPSVRRAKPKGSPRPPRKR